MGRREEEEEKNERSRMGRKKRRKMGFRGRNVGGDISRQGLGPKKEKKRAITNLEEIRPKKGPKFSEKVRTAVCTMFDFSSRIGNTGIAFPHPKFPVSIPRLPLCKAGLEGKRREWRRQQQELIKIAGWDGRRENSPGA